MADKLSNRLAKADELANGLTSDLSNDVIDYRTARQCVSVDYACGYNEAVTKANKIINRQKAEIERLRKGWRADIIDSANEREANVKGFMEDVEQWKEEANKYQSLWVNACTEAKSEAIREFAERLKETIDGNSSGYLFIPEKRFDNLVKEMTEGNR